MEETIGVNRSRACVACLLALGCKKTEPLAPTLPDAAARAQAAAIPGAAQATRGAGVAGPLTTQVSWPRPLTAEELGHPTREVLGDRAGDWVGETSRRFLSDDRFTIGGLLVSLEQRRIVAVPGEIAE